VLQGNQDRDNKISTASTSKNENSDSSEKYPEALRKKKGRESQAYGEGDKKGEGDRRMPIRTQGNIIRPTLLTGGLFKKKKEKRKGSEPKGGGVGLWENRKKTGKGTYPLSFFGNVEFCFKNKGKGGARKNSQRGPFLKISSKGRIRMRSSSPLRVLASRGGEDERRLSFDEGGTML